MQYCIDWRFLVAFEALQYSTRKIKNHGQNHLESHFGKILVIPWAEFFSRLFLFYCMGGIVLRGRSVGRKIRGVSSYELVEAIVKSLPQYPPPPALLLICSTYPVSCNEA